MIDAATPKERREVEALCRKLGEVMRDTRYPICLATLRILAAHIIKQAAWEKRPMIVDEFSSELRRDVLGDG